MNISYSHVVVLNTVTVLPFDVDRDSVVRLTSFHCSPVALKGKYKIPKNWRIELVENV